jgi:UDP-GlcNAc3NAcA epimerase
MKVVTVIGARPQFIKAAAVSSVLRKEMDEIIIHTGQHYDTTMSDVFFEELDIPKPNYFLQIGSGNHGEQTGEMLSAIEKVLLIEQPDFVLVYGDTNSTLAGALAASKLLIPVIHVEAGLRSFNKAMPEEQNRILTDHLSTLLFVPTQNAIENLANEGINKGVYFVGDVMYDGILHFSEIAKHKSKILETLGLSDREYILCTIHRAENTNDPLRLKQICSALGNSKKHIVLPLHPRTQKYIADYNIQLASNITVIEPVGYLDMVQLEVAATKIVTDSGGVQKEAFFLNKPCITLRDETEWIETIQNGWNCLVGADELAICDAITRFNPTAEKKSHFGTGNAASLIVAFILNY